LEVQTNFVAFSELLLNSSLLECLAAKLRDHLFPLKKAQEPNSTSIPGVPLTCWGCKKHGHKKIHCPDLSCYYCGKRGHCKRICLTYRLSVWYDREQKNRKNAYDNAKPLFVRNKKSPPVSTESSNPKRSSMSIQQPSVFSTEPFMSPTIQLHNPTEVEIKNSQQNSNTVIKSTKNSKIIPSNQPLYVQNRADKNSTKSKIIPLYAQRKTCYKCSRCECTFMEKKNLAEHLKRIHNTDKPEGHQLHIHATNKVCEICGGHGYSLIKIKCLEDLCVTCISKNLTVTENGEQYHIKCPFDDSDHNLQSHEGVFIEVLVGKLTDDTLIDYGVNVMT